MKKVFICSPYRGNITRNELIAKILCQLVISEGNMPLAPHLYFTRFLDDTDEAQRERGITLGLMWLMDCAEILIYTPDGISEGMEREIREAKIYGIPIRYEKTSAWRIEV